MHTMLKTAHSLSDHFASFFRNINPSPTFEATASSQYNTIKSLIEDRSGPAAVLLPRCFLQGSYRQQTAIHSINDVDIVVLCSLWQPGSGSGPGWSRDNIFGTIAAPVLADGRYRSKVRYGPSSMCIKVDLGIKVEILPVVYKAGTNDFDSEPFRLYRPAAQNWDDGYARHHQKHLTAKNSSTRTAGNFIPCVKVLKHLRSVASAEAVSFHIECLLYSLPDNLFLGGPADYIPRVLRSIVATPAAEWYAKPVRTPCGDRDIFTPSEWTAEKWLIFHSWLEHWAREAAAARDASYATHAIERWQSILGDRFFPASVA